MKSSEASAPSQFTSYVEVGSERGVVVYSLCPSCPDFHDAEWFIKHEWSKQTCTQYRIRPRICSPCYNKQLEARGLS